MPVRINVRELKQVLEITPPDQNVMLVGRHGIGKSDILTDFFHGQGMKVISFFLGQMSDPGDLIGLLRQDQETGRSEFMPPYWWPQADSPVVLFLDELNRARPELLQSIMELALHKTMAGKALPVGSRIVAAVNDGDLYQITEMDPALVSRFNLYEFVPTVEDWLDWANRKGMDARIRSFLTSQPHHLDEAAPSEIATTGSTWNSGLEKTADRRGWERAANLIQSIDTLQDLHFKLLAGVVGAKAANAFRNHLQEALPVSAEDVLVRWNENSDIVLKLSLPQLAKLNQEILFYVGSEESNSNVDRDLLRNGMLNYVKKLRDEQQQEAVAHLTSLLQQPAYANALPLVAESVELTVVLSDYMEGLRVE